MIGKASRCVSGGFFGSFLAISTKSALTLVLVLLVVLLVVVVVLLVLLVVMVLVLVVVVVVVVGILHSQTCRVHHAGYTHLDVGRALGTRLHVQDVVLLRVCARLLEFHLTLVLQIHLVTRQRNHHIRVPAPLELLHPRLGMEVGE